MDSKPYQCGICFSLLYDPVTTTCAHSYCRKCWVASFRRDPRCPLCRRVQVSFGVQPDPELREEIIRQSHGEYLERSRENPLTVLFLGPSGTGKSATINSLASENICPVNAFKPETSSVSAHLRVIETSPDSLDPGSDAVAFKLVDTPGLFPCDSCDGRCSKEVSRANKRRLECIERFVEKGETCSGGGGSKEASKKQKATEEADEIHCVAWCERADRDRPSERDDVYMIQLLTEKLGSRMWKYAALVLTHVDDVEDRSLHRQAQARYASLLAAVREVCKDQSIRMPTVLISNVRNKSMEMLLTGSVTGDTCAEEPGGYRGMHALTSTLAQLGRQYEEDMYTPVHSPDDDAVDLSQWMIGPPEPSLHGGLPGIMSWHGWRIETGRPESFRLLLIKGVILLLDSLGRREPLWLVALKQLLLLASGQGFLSISVVNNSSGY